MTAQTIDRAKLAELDDLFGAATTDSLLAPMFRELEVVPGAIRILLVNGQIDAARTAAHGLRGAALGLGCIGVADTCGRIEDGAVDTLPACADELILIARQTAETLTRLR